MIDNDIEFQRLLALASGAVAYRNEHDAEQQIAEEERLFNALMRRGGTPRQAARKLKVLAIRLRADGQQEYPEGQRNLALLESAIEDLGSAE
jgi:hypothetical protein